MLRPNIFHLLQIISSTSYSASSFQCNKFIHYIGSAGAVSYYRQFVRFTPFIGGSEKRFRFLANKKRTYKLQYIFQFQI